MRLDDRTRPATAAEHHGDDSAAGLLLVALGAVLGAAAGVWLIAETGSYWGVPIALGLSLLGLAALLALVVRQLGDGDDE